jgi:hypothetical protein
MNWCNEPAWSFAMKPDIHARSQQRRSRRARPLWVVVSSAVRRAWGPTKPPFAEFGAWGDVGAVIVSSTAAAKLNIDPFMRRYAESLKRHGTRIFYLFTEFAAMQWPKPHCRLSELSRWNDQSIEPRSLPEPFIRTCLARRCSC